VWHVSTVSLYRQRSFRARGAAHQQERVGAIVDRRFEAEFKLPRRVQPHVPDEIVGGKSRSCPRHARLAHCRRQHQVTGLLVADQALHRGEVCAEAVVRPRVEADLTDCRTFAEQHLEVGWIRIVSRRSPEAKVRGIVDVVKHCGTREDAPVHTVVPEVRGNAPIAAAVIVVPGEPRIGKRRAVSDHVNGPRSILASLATSVGRVLAEPADARLGCGLAQGFGKRCIEEQRLRRDWLDCCNTYCERTGNSGDPH